MAPIKERIGIRELRQHASRYLVRVEQGEVIEITRHGRPVARLVGAGSDGARGIEPGLVEAAEDDGDLLDIIPAPARPPGATTASQELSRMREDERS